MKVRVTLMTINDVPVSALSALGADPEKTIITAWNLVLNSLNSNDTAYVEKVEIVEEEEKSLETITQEEWDEAVKRTQELLKEYQNLGFIGSFGQAHLLSLLNRYERGERTEDLYESMRNAE